MKPKIKPRNPLVAAALFRKAGKHGKPFKAERHEEKVKLNGLLAERQGTWLLTRSRTGSNPSQPTIKLFFGKQSHASQRAVEIQTIPR